MDILEHYINLRMAFSKENEDQEVLTTTPYLAECMSCTIRNTNFVMKKIIEKGWASWSPQKGRGKRSTLVFHFSLLDAASLNVQRLIKERKVEEAYAFATSMKLPASITGVLLNLLQKQFGLYSESDARKRVDVLKIPTDAKIHTLDPAMIGIVHEAHLVLHIFDTLIRYDTKNHTFQPGLALAWEERFGGKEWIFYLRKGVLFHHAKTLTAMDVLFTFNRLREDETIPVRDLFSIIEKIEVYDEVTISFTLKNKSYFFLDLMSSFYASILPKDVEVNDKQPIGTGPFRVGRHDHNILVLESFNHYFLGRPFLDQIEIWHVPEVLASSEREEKIFLEEKNREKTTYKELGSYYLMFNFNKKGPHHDRNLRQAIRETLNQQELISQLGFPRRIPAKSFLVQRSESEKEALVSLEKAKGFLSNSSYKGELLQVGTFDFKEAIDDMNWLKERCEEIGIYLNVIPIPLESIYEQSGMNQYDFFYAGETFDENELLSLFIMYSSKNSVIRMGLDQHLRRKLDQMLAEVDSEPNLSKRIEKFYLIEEWLKHNVITILTYHTLEEQSYHKALNGIEVSGFGMPDLRRLWVKRSKEETQEEVKYSIYIP